MQWSTCAPTPALTALVKYQRLPTLLSRLCGELMAKLLLASFCNHLWGVMTNSRQATDEPSTSQAGLAVPLTNESPQRGHKTWSRQQAGMAPTDHDDEDRAIEAEFPSFPTRMDRSATYIWPRLGASAEDSPRGTSKARQPEFKLVCFCLEKSGKMAVKFLPHSGPLSCCELAAKRCWAAAPYGTICNFSS